MKRLLASRGARAVIASTVLLAVLGLQTAFVRANAKFQGQSAFRRLWSDFALGVNAYFDATEGAPAIGDRPDPTGVYRDIMSRHVKRSGIEPHEFWRTLPARPFLRERAPVTAVAFNDPGRAVLLGLGFRILGGISPFLIVWLGLLAAAPVLVWLWIEFGRANWWVGGATLSLLLAASPYIVQCLSLSRYAVGFYLVAGLAALTVIVPAVAPSPPRPAGSMARAFLAGIILAAAISCRSSVVFMLPGVLAAFAVAAYRGSFTAATRLRTFVCAAALLLAPSVLTRSTDHHDIWPPLWEGLGDFDRKYDHAWSDGEATRLAREAGLSESVDFRMPEAEPIFKKAVLGHVTSDPGWFAAILVKRLGATLTLWKLWPLRAIDGQFMRRTSSPNEGFIDKYYTYTRTVDYFGFASHTMEFPVQLLLLPSVVLAGLSWSAATRASVLPFIVGISLLALVLTPLPVLVTTAGGQETQAFALVHMLAAAFLAQKLYDARRSRRSVPET